MKINYLIIPALVYSCASFAFTFSILNMDSIPIKGLMAPAKTETHEDTHKSKTGIQTQAAITGTANGLSDGIASYDKPGAIGSLNGLACKSPYFSGYYDCKNNQVVRILMFNP